ATGTGWTCTSTQLKATCTLATLATGASSTLAVVLIAPGVAGQIENVAYVAATTIDLVDTNNSARVTTIVEGPIVEPTDPHYGVRGGGCDAGAGAGGSGFVVALASLLGIVRRRRTWTVLASLAVVLLAGPAHAQLAGGSERFPIERLRIATDRDGLLGVEWADSPGVLAWNVGTYLGYANDPLTIYDTTTGERVGSLVGTRVGGGLVGSVGVASWLSIGAELPLIYAQSRSAPADMMLDTLTSATIGDLRLAPKFVIRPGIAAIVSLGLPTSGDTGYAGDGGVTFAPELAISQARGDLRLAANLGYLARSPARLGDLVVDDELRLRLAVGYRVDAAHLEVDLGFTAATAAAAPFAHVNTDPYELDLGVRVAANARVDVFGIAGFGIGGGFGAPDGRALIGVRVATGGRKPVPASPADRDGDGITDELDKCPADPEDVDGFEDADGCPDVDNDKDGIPDTLDKCNGCPPEPKPEPTPEVKPDEVKPDDKKPDDKKPDDKKPDDIEIEMENP
ncbi:MAG: transporter, partial [Proteobacteria bacterium]|nr:transporter [Pseudomonadota bacterium]